MPFSAPRRALVRLATVLAAALVLGPAFAACGVLPAASQQVGLVGTGDTQQDLRELDAISRVSVAGGFKVIVGTAPEQQVVVEAQANLLPAIRTEVRDGQLIVTAVAENGISSSKPMSITVKVPSLQSVVLSNGATGYIERTGTPLSLDVSGGSDLTAIGDTPDLTLNVTSGAKANLGQLVAAKAEITVNDGGSAELNVTGTLSGKADGGSTVFLTTKPATVNVETSSGATVQGG